VKRLPNGGRTTMSKSDFPAEMMAELNATPDWVMNVGFADALGWVAWGIEQGWIPEPVTPEWLHADADKTYTMSLEDWKAIQEDA
jgi:hypothetical protein